MLVPRPVLEMETKRVTYGDVGNKENIPELVCIRSTSARAIYQPRAIRCSSSFDHSPIAPSAARDTTLIHRQRTCITASFSPTRELISLIEPIGSHSVQAPKRVFSQHPTPRVSSIWINTAARHTTTTPRLPLRAHSPHLHHHVGPSGLLRPAA
jgi:hypothetical protein